jgi:hypothetical protein
VRRAAQIDKDHPIPEIMACLLAAQLSIAKAKFSLYEALSRGEISMALLNVPLNPIREARLRALIAAGAAESRTIDYKRESYGNAHSDLSEWLADVS